MGGDDSQKLLPWRGINLLSGAQTSGSQQINTVTETAGSDRGHSSRTAQVMALSYRLTGSFLESRSGSILASAEAVEAAVAFPRAAIVPGHHSGWAHFTQSQDDLIKTFATVRLSDRLRPVSPSGTIVIVAPDLACPEPRIESGREAPPCR